MKDLLTAPIEDKESIKRLGIMTAITLLSIFILPLFILLGYYIKTATHKGKGLPPIRNYKKLFIRGLRVAIGLIGIIMLIGFIIVLLASIPASAEIIDLLLVLATILVIVPIIYISPGILITIGHRNSIKTGFSRETVSKCFTEDFLIAWLAVIAFRIGMGIIISLLIVSIIGLLLAPLAWVYESLVRWRIWGDGFKFE